MTTKANFKMLPSLDNESNLAKLARGLFLLNIKKEMAESAYTAMGRITKERKVVSRRQEYCSDLERVIDESKLTTQLLSEVHNETKVGKKILQPEEVINYYNGIFLDQVHQIKDKLFRLVDRLLIVPEKVPDSKKKDPDKVKVPSFLLSHKAELEKIGIYELLEQWEKGSIAVVLRKRTQHHHFVSTLRLNEDFQKIQMSRMMLNSQRPIPLSEYGVKRLTEIGEESFKKWREEIVGKQQSTVIEIEQNIGNITEKIIQHFNIPIAPEDITPIANGYIEFLSSFDIKNESHINKIPQELKELIDGIVEIAKQSFGQTLASIYLVGSVPRGEFLPGSSDINIYFIIKDEKTIFAIHDKFPLLNATFLTKKAFISDAHKKDRFICWSDGVLLFGEEIKFNEKEFPKPGILLSLLLNRDFIEKLEKIKKEVEALSNPDAETLRPYSLKAAKIVMDWDFGVAMGNKPFYTASREGKIQYTKESWPDERRTITIEQLYKDNATIKKEDFPALIDVFLEQAKPNFQRLLDIETEVIKDATEE